MNTKTIKVAIVSRKGGVGKTAITSFLARYFTEVEERKVLLIDFDGRGGLTSLFHKDPLTTNSRSIGDMLAAIANRADPNETFSQALIKIDPVKNFGWKKGQGSLFLIPCKPLLDDFLPDKDPQLLRLCLNNLDLDGLDLVLIDSGPDHLNVEMVIAAADVVFQPLMFSRQDVHPSVETLRTIIVEQRTNHSPFHGGIIINQVGKTQWEDRYHQQYLELITRFRENTEIRMPAGDPLIPVKRSRIIQRGKHLSQPWLPDLIKASKRISGILYDPKNY